MFKKIILLMVSVVLVCGVVLAKELPIDVSAEVVPEDVSESELDAWLSQNKENFDFYVEGRSVAEHRKDVQRKILQARKEAQEKIARIDERLKEQQTGNKVKDKELLQAAENKKQKVYQEELALEEKLLNRQLRREVAIMRRKEFSKSKIANIQKEFRDQLTWMKQNPTQRINAAAASMPDADPDIVEESGGKAKIKMDKKRKITVEHKPYGGDMSDRARRRLRSR